MKLSAQEEYGLRCLLQMASRGDEASLSIPEISRAEGLSVPNVAKLMRLLRIAGFVKSVRGQSGGYSLAKPASAILVGEVLEALGGKLFGEKFCGRHSGLESACVHNTDCSMRALWIGLQHMLEKVLFRTTLAELMQKESVMHDMLESRHGALILPQPANSTTAHA
ncbi:MAG: Rrf2 family transcriptional regulator [Acidobacteria bacterium]|nr:Rrf2 family transcriptional regulator [Acidobacteriota bacterium]